MKRENSIDIVRGIVMIIMALDQNICCSFATSTQVN